MAASKYETHVLPYLDKIEEWIHKGATEKEIAEKLGVAYSSLRKYLDAGRNGDERYTALSAAFARACVEPDDEVEASLFKLACGYTVDLQKTFKIKKAKFDRVTGRKISEWEELVTGVDQMHVPANVEAQKFWLANRRRDKWQYKPEAGAERDGEGETFGVVMIPDVQPPQEEPADE